MIASVFGWRPPAPQIYPRRLVPTNMYHQFNNHSQSLISHSTPKSQLSNYQLEDLSWQDLLATLNASSPKTSTCSPQMNSFSPKTNSCLPRTSNYCSPQTPQTPQTNNCSPKTNNCSPKTNKSKSGVLLTPPPPKTPSPPPPQPPPPITPPPLTQSSSKYEQLTRCQTSAIYNKTTSYPINTDPAPQIINRRSEHKLQYVQEVAVRYLKPPTPEPPGDILIKEENNVPGGKLAQLAPPLIIRQAPARPRTPAPLIVRELPPPMPSPIPRKVITISSAKGKQGPPPPRKVVIERLPKLPAKPRSVIIERWLPYEEQKRKVIYRPPPLASSLPPKPPVVLKPKNVIIQWDTPEVHVTQRVRDLGVIDADPVEYLRRYGDSVIQSENLPEFVREIPKPTGLKLAAETPPTHNKPPYPLYGDLDALRLVDLEREGLGEYNGVVVSGSSTTVNDSVVESESSHLSKTTNVSHPSLSLQNLSRVSPLILNIFANINLNNTGQISIDEMNKTFYQLNNCLGRDYGPAELNEFFNNMDTNRDGYIDLSEFKNFFKRNI